MDMRLLERSCVVCGADLQIVLDGDNNIVSGGYYFTTHLDEGEYWECIKCYEDSDEIGEQ
jgi:hypothetical protein